LGCNLHLLLLEKYHKPKILKIVTNLSKVATAIGKISRVRLKTPLECLESDPMQVAFNKVTLLIAEAVRVRMILR
jgi:hypothetical protein